MIIYGKNPALELLRRRPELARELLLARPPKGERADGELEYAAKAAGVRVNYVPKEDIFRMTKSDSHQGVAVNIPAFDYADFEDMAEETPEGGLVVGLDSIQDPQNLGAIIRSAAALGASGVFFPKDRSAEITPSAIKASAGLCFAIPVAQVTNLARSLEKLFDLGYWVIGAAAGEGKPIDEVDLPGKRALVLGSEGEGLRRLTREKCQQLAYIPMAEGVDSLNASVAAAIMIYSLTKTK